MKLTVVLDDQLMIKDGVKLTFDVNDMAIDVSNVWALHWDDNLAVPGEMELRNGQVNLPFTDIATVTPFLDVFDTRIAEINAPLALEDYKKAKKALMEGEAQANILAGFTSNALGAVHTYGGKETDQINLIGAATSGIDMVFPCADSEGTWQRRSHTAAQLSQVLSDGSAYKQTVLVALDLRRNEIDLATNHDEVDAVVWVS